MKLKLGHIKIGQIIIFGVFFSIILLYFPFVQNYSITPKWVALSFFCLVSFSFKGSSLQLNKFHLLWFLFAFQYFIQCFFSYNFWDAVAHGVPLILAPLLLSAVFNRNYSFSSVSEQLAFISALCITPILFYCLFELIFSYYSGEYSHASTYDYRFTFGHRNQFSQFITLLIPLISLGIYFTKSQRKKVFFYVVIVLIYATAILLKSRAVAIVLVFIYPVTASVFVLFRSRKKSLKYLKLSLGAILLFGFTVLISYPLKEIPYVNKLVEVSYGSGNERVRLWSNSIELFKENPLLGKGSGDWKIEILKTPLEHTQAENSLIFYSRAHNDFLQVLVENGILGLFLYLLFFIVCIVQLLRSAINPVVKSILFSGVLAYLVFSCFSFPIEKVEHLFLLFLFLSPCFISGEKTSKSTKSIFLILSIISLSFSLLWIVEEKKYTDSIENNDLTLIRKMSKTFYTIDPTTLPLEWYLANDYFYKGDFENAIGSYVKSLSHNPYHVHAINNLGSSYYKQNQIDLAEMEYKKALAINPLFTETLMNYSSLCFNKGRIDDALNLILKIEKDLEPESYKSYIAAIGASKVDLIIEKEKEGVLKQYLINNKSNTDYLYQIAISARKTSLSYEDQIRKSYKELIITD